MKLATLPHAGPDGRLVVVGPDLTRCLAPPPELPTLQAALDDWEAAEPALRSLYGRLAAEPDAGEPLDPSECLAPLPRAYGWVDGSAYLTHMERLRAARGAQLPPDHLREPIVYRSGSDRFLASSAPIPLPDPTWDLDFEATVAVVTGAVPRQAGPAAAATGVRLVLLADDLTYRAILPGEMAKGVGLFHAKPPRPFAPIAVTPDALGAGWRDGLLHATVRCWVNGDLLGELDPSADCAFTFPELLAFLARTRDVLPGTVLGSGTISNRDPGRGFGCLAERRATQARDGAPRTPFLRTGDRLRIEAFDADGTTIFGPMEHAIVDPCGEPTDRRQHDREQRHVDR